MDPLNGQLKSGVTEPTASPIPGKRTPTNDSANVLDGSGEPNKTLTFTNETECPHDSGETYDSIPSQMNDSNPNGMNELDVNGNVGEMQVQKLDAQVQSGISFPNLENLVEFRYDLINSTQFIEDRTHEIVYPHTAFNLGPSNPQVFTVVEMVSHYYSQPCCMYISGEWVSSHIQIPVAQHLCVSLDDGSKRYEQVFRLDLLRSAVNAEPQSQFLQSIEHRVVRGNPSHRPRFRDIIRRSLFEVLKYLTDTTFEIIISRATGRCLSMDFMITNFFSENRPGCVYDLYVTPLIQHVPQQLDVSLAGIHYKLSGLLYRPYLGYASILLTRADVQLFETLSLSIYGSDRKIIAVTLDSAMARIITNSDNISTGISLLEAICYAQFGPTCTGMNVLSQNPRVGPAHHPFCNLAQNPYFNRGLNPYYSSTFHPPTTLPCPPPPPFPHLVPFGLPYGCQIPPGAVIQQPITLPVILPPGFQQVAPREIERHTVRLDSSNEEPRPATSPPERKAPGQESTTKLNPHARDFYPQGYHAMVAAPFPVQIGPEEINLSQLESEPDDQVLVSSLQPYKPGSLSVADMEALNINPMNPAGQSSSSEISMIVNHATGGFLTQSESHCSVLDPDTSIEILSSHPVCPMYNQSWSEQVDYEDDQQHFADNSDTRGRKPHRGFPRGFRGTPEEWAHRARYNRWANRRNDEEFSQDLRLGHGFNQRNFNQGRGHFDGERGHWGFPRGRARGRGYGFSRQQQSDFDQHRRGAPTERQVTENEDENAIQRKRQGQAEKTNRQIQTSDEDDATNTNSSDKALSYAAAAKTNVPEEVQKVSHQVPSSPRRELKEEDQYPGPKGHHYNSGPPPGFRPGFRPSSAQNEYNDPQRQEFEDQRPPYRNRNFHGRYSPRDNWTHDGESNGPNPRRFPPRENNWNTGESETHPRGRYPPRNTWNNPEGETVEGPSTSQSRGARLPNNPRFQNPRGSQPPKSSRRPRGPNSQDPPTPNDFPPLAPVPAVVPVKVPKEPKHEATKPNKPGRGTSAPRRNKKFRKFEKEGSTSSDDRKDIENYLSDVIPNKERVAKKEDHSEDDKSDDTLEGGTSPDEEKNECNRTEDAQGDGSLQPESEKELTRTEKDPDEPSEKLADPPTSSAQADGSDSKAEPGIGAGGGPRK